FENRRLRHWHRRCSATAALNQLYRGQAVPVEQSATNTNTQRFTGYLADTRESRRIHYRIRYQVYCERKGFEDNAVLRKRGLERDAYDGHAVPFIFHDEHEGRWRGTARLVVRGSQPLPVEMTSALPSGYCEGYKPGTLGEVSRLASVSPATCTGRERWALLISTLGSVLTCAYDFGLRDVLFLVTPGLARIVSKLDIPMAPIGRAVQHRGRRQAFISPVSEALDSVRQAGADEGYKLYSAREERGTRKMLA
ncbi:MAG: GNAT family N-acetyltransferase, partial [Spiribacter salinus]